MEQKQHTGLTTSRDDARKKLQKRIKDGREIIAEPIQPEDIPQKMECEKKWYGYNMNLLSKLFTTHEYADHYNDARILVHQIVDRYFDHTIGAVILQLTNSVKQQIARLESIIEQLELIDEPAAVQFVGTLAEYEKLLEDIGQQPWRYEEDLPRYIQELVDLFNDALGANDYSPRIQRKVGDPSYRRKQILAAVRAARTRFTDRPETFTRTVAPLSDNRTINEPSIESVVTALNSFDEIVRYLNTRRSKPVLEIGSEAAVQNVIYMMLRPWIPDLVPEDPNGKVANRFTIKDFWSRAGRFVIEAKYVRDAAHGKRLAEEINDDIENYRKHPYCDDLVFVIYDPDKVIPDANAIMSHLRDGRSYDGKELRCHGVIKS
jgi:hypothetical protein